MPSFINAKAQRNKGFCLLKKTIKKTLRAFVPLFLCVKVAAANPKNAELHRATRLTPRLPFTQNVV
jgi:hypothetical protein